MVNENRNMTPFFVPIILLLASLEGVIGQNYSNNIRCFEGERQALLKFREDLADDYDRLSSWGVGDNKRECCKWRGVHCHNRTNHVTQLNLRALSEVYYPLKGKISPSLLELKHLTHVDLSSNYFVDSNFPEFIGSFEKLQYLDLSGVDLSGQIPQSIGNLSKLMYLDLKLNFALYSKDLDWVSHFGSLKYLDLSFVNLRKASNWFQAISKSTSIKELHFSGCGLQDIHPFSLPSINASVPLAILDLSWNPDISSSTFQRFLNYSSSLTSIDFSSNNLSGSFLNAFHNRMSFTYLNLFSNPLECGIPEFFGNMSSLVHLNLGETGLKAHLSELMMNLSGPLEKKLKHLDLKYNMITGSLPNFSWFSSLNRLELQGNKLNGSIAKGHLNIPYLVHLDLSSNNFTGILLDLTSFPLLQNLYLNNNMFEGDWAESIGCLSKMDDLVPRSSNLEGIATESHLFNLSSLQFLDLSNNSLLTLNCSPHWIPPFQLKAISLSQCKIGPRFPQWLQFQRNLKFLDLSSSQIADTFPSWFSNLASRLTVLIASNNQIYGDFPKIEFSNSILTMDSPFIPRYRIMLDLSRNKITGQVSFLCYYVEWGLIDLSDNLFSGHLPNCFANYTTLLFLNLAKNNFFGEIPNSFGSLRSLRLLNLRNNSFSGGIPTSLRNCTKLKVIDLGENMLTGNIPTWLGDNFQNLIVLSLRLNEFHGAIPWSVCSLQIIKVLDLSSNRISGVIPRCLNNLTALTDKPSRYPGNEYYTSSIKGYAFMRHFTLFDGVYFMWKGNEVTYANHLKFVELIDLSNNVLIGDIPYELTKLVALVALNLSKNNLTGFIPQNIGLLKSLDSLDLSRNHLSGGIPISIAELSFLGILNLSYNNLSGRIPQQFIKFDESSYKGNPGLCGRPVLNKSCPGEDEMKHRDSNFNSDDNTMNTLEHEDDIFITNGFYICMGFGFVTGFWGIFGIILLNKSARVAYFKLLNTIEDFVYVRVQLSKAHLKRRFQNYVSSRQ